ncbi:primosomal replication protein N [Chitinibacter tainanensis]|uniref:primosomal replication protein N n=1 Tax=Chitinibacter tainanensis TaxID=230667 RepID=UPI00357126D0
MEGLLLNRQALRTTPAGVAIIEGTISHQSEQTEAGQKRKVDCEILFVALGNIAQQIAQVPIGTAIKSKGFLAARSMKFRQSLIFHLEAFDFLN